MEEHRIVRMKKEIYKDVNFKPYDIITEIEEFLKEKPEDYFVRLLYGKSLLRVKEIDKAKSEYAKVREELYGQDKIKKYDDYNQAKLKERSISLKLRLLGQEQLYENFVNQYWANRYIVPKKYDNNLSNAYDYAMIQLGCAPFHINESSTYFRRQIVDYDRSRLIEFSKSRKGTNVFNLDFNYELVLNEIEKYINDNNTEYLLDDYIGKLYVFKLDQCGFDLKNLEYMDYIWAVTVGSSKDIITIIPNKEGKRFKYIDLNYLKEDNPVKKITIDKM